MLILLALMMMRHITKNMARGDLVRWSKTNLIGIVMDIFDDLDPKNPWVRVVFQTGEAQSFQWCKQSSLQVIKKEGVDNDPFSVDAKSESSGSL